MRTDWVERDVFELLLTALMPANRRAIEVSEVTGLRIGDVLSLPTVLLARGQRFTVREQKTGKSKRVYIPRGLYGELMAHAGARYVFEGRTGAGKHRTRQAVFKDLKRVAKLYRVDGVPLKENIAPHTARKVYAVEMFEKYGSMKKVAELLNHENEAVTMLYALSDRVGKKMRA